jgi:hypothetical protein
VISSRHGGDPHNADLVFIKQDGTRIVPTISAVKSLSGYSPGGNVFFDVYYLDEDLPAGIAHYPIFCDALELTVGTPLVKFVPSIGGDGGKATITEINAWPWTGEVPTQLWGSQLWYRKWQGSVNPPSEAIRARYWIQTDFGHSGSPAFLVVGTQLLYIGQVIGSDESGSDPRVRIGPIVAACKELDTANTGYLPDLWGHERNAGVRSIQIQRMSQ